MLVLTRNYLEEIVVILPDGSEICVSHQGERGKGIRFGIEAPQAFQVHRREIWEKIKRERDAQKGATS